MRPLLVLLAALLSPASLAQQKAHQGAPRPLERKVQRVRERRLPELQALFARAGVPYPAPRLFLRAFKEERQLELWAGGREGPLARVHVFPVCAASGGPGPKREEGDGQVPEGLYRIDRLNPGSSFHLSLGLDYPNPADRARSRGLDPGGDIFIHGACVSIGCLAIEDGGIELLYVAVADSKARHRTQVPVLLLPKRLGAAGELPVQPASGVATDTLALWQSLARVNAAFEAERRVPRTRVDARTGTYVLEPPAGPRLRR